LALDTVALAGAIGGTHRAAIHARPDEEEAEANKTNNPEGESEKCMAARHGFGLRYKGCSREQRDANAADGFMAVSSFGLTTWR
jgi:hypothetical protein